MVESLHKTLEQELNALFRGVSLECLVCGEFLLRSGRTLSCPECGSHLRAARDSAEAGLQFRSQAG
jgi:Zn finger protein HypA/HybF involved in hydrogenase expression